VTYLYDAIHPRLTTLIDGLGTTSYVYGAVGSAGALAVTAIDGPHADDTVTYAHDALGRVTARQLDGTGWTLGYDALGRPASLAHALGTFTWGYVGATGRVASLTFPTGMTSTYSYVGNAGDRRLQTIHHRTSAQATLSRFDYTYDGVRNLVTWRQERAGQAAFQYTFTHDRVDQLTAAVKRSTDPTPVVLARQAWSYDAAGNRTAAQHGDAVQASSFDSLNRLVTRQGGGPLALEGTVSEPATVTIDGQPALVDAALTFRGTAETASGTTTVTVTSRDGAGNTAVREYEVDVAGSTTSYAYDAAGRLTSDGVKTYVWNARNQLVKVQEGGLDVAVFTYDGFGRRATKTAGGVTATYIYDGEDIVEERRSAGDVIRYVLQTQAAMSRARRGPSRHA
jgi:YD repeat-containing protein